MLFKRRKFFVKERVAALKLTDTYDIYDPETKQTVGIARDEPPTWAKLMRLLVKKVLLPTVVRVYESEAAPALISLHKAPAFLRTIVVVQHPTQGEIGRFKSKLFSLGGGFDVYDRSGEKVAEVKGDWKGWNFRMIDRQGRALGVVTKKWAGLGRELFTSADNYMIALDDHVTTPDDQAPLLLAAGLAIDIVFKEAA
jgi:uncharacterized protein YxjI